MERPRLSVALIDAADAAQAGRIHEKLAGVCQQFLDWPVSERITVLDAHDVTEQHVLSYRPVQDGGQAEWRALDAFVAKAAHAMTNAGESALATHSDETAESTSPADGADRQGAESASALHWVGDVVVPTPAPVGRADRPESHAMSSAAGHHAAFAPERESAPESLPFAASVSGAGKRQDISEIIDLSDIADSDEAMLDAILQNAGGEWVECPVRAPMCPEARVTIARDHRLVLVAIARHGQSPSGSIGQGYRWLVENR
jgi:hypothetical protein